MRSDIAAMHAALRNELVHGMFGDGDGDIERVQDGVHDPSLGGCVEHCRLPALICGQVYIQGLLRGLAMAVTRCEVGPPAQTPCTQRPFVGRCWPTPGPTTRMHGIFS